MVIKSNVISVKDEIQQPKILGKIDLSPKPLSLIHIFVVGSIEFCEHLDP